MFEIDSELHNTSDETDYQEEQEEVKPESVNKLKYPCPKCDESFSLKVDLKVYEHITFLALLQTLFFRFT